MKKSLLILVVALLSTNVFSQSVFDKFENHRDVNTFVVTKNMFRLMSKIDLSSNDPEAQNYLNMVENLDNFRIFRTDNANTAAEMRRTVDSYIGSSSGLSELMRINEEGKNIRFYTRSSNNENIVSELFMFVEDPNGREDKAIIMSITGKIDLRQISQLTKDLNVPGSNQLKNVKNK